MTHRLFERLLDPRASGASRAAETVKMAAVRRRLARLRLSRAA